MTTLIPKSSYVCKSDGKTYFVIDCREGGMVYDSVDVESTSWIDALIDHALICVGRVRIEWEG
jgi:hypothetical protein